MIKKIFVGFCFAVLSPLCFAAVKGNIESGKALSGPCVACHTDSGNSVNPIWPKIAGQHQAYLESQLHEFKKAEKGNRNVPTMLGMVAGLSDQDIADLAAFYANQEMTLAKATPDAIELGEAIYRGGILDRGVSACIACHGPTGMGNALANFPRVASQHAEYNLQQLQAFKSGARVHPMMNDTAKKMTDAEMAAVSNYMQGLRKQGEHLPPIEEASAPTEGDEAPSSDAQAG